MPADDCRLVTTGSPLIFVVEDEVKDQVSGKKRKNEVGKARAGSTAYDDRARKNKIGGTQINLCFTCAGKFLHGSPKHYVRQAFWDKDPEECVAKWGTEFLRTTWLHAASDSTRGRTPARQAQHLKVLLKGMEAMAE